MATKVTGGQKRMVTTDLHWSFDGNPQIQTNTWSLTHLFRSAQRVYSPLHLPMELINRVVMTITVNRNFTPCLIFPRWSFFGASYKGKKNKSTSAWSRSHGLSWCTCSVPTFYWCFTNEWKIGHSYWIQPVVSSEHDSLPYILIWAQYSLLNNERPWITCIAKKTKWSCWFGCAESEYQG